MSNGFRFRQFSVRDDRCAMRVGTDGILLGAWVDVQNATRILDIGTGCGLIALMMAQQNLTAMIDAIEIDTEAANQASENVAASPWSSRIAVIHSSLEEFVGHPENASYYDLIVCNPPFFSGSTISADDRRSTARHGNQLSLDFLFSSVRHLIHLDGRIAIIVPFARRAEIERLVGSLDLSITKIVEVAAVSDQTPNRLLFELKKSNDSSQITLRIAVYQSQGIYSNEFWAMSRDYYLPETPAAPPLE